MNLRITLAIALALAPGLAAWIGVRRMLRHVGDPLFTERLFAHRVAMVYVYLFLILVSIVLAPSAALWLLPLTLLSIAVGGFPGRAVLYGESWTLPQYLLSRIRLVVLAGGPWIALLAAPTVLAGAGVRWTPLVFVAVLALYFFQSRLLLLGLSARPLADDALLQRLEPILAKTQAPRPEILAGGSETGRFTNAFAMPDGKRSRVMITHALLRELEPQETAAIFAHEAAHLEQWALPNMRIRLWTGRVLIPAFAVIPQAILLLNESSAANAAPLAKWWPVLWPLVFLIGMMLALIRRQAHETEADLRALDLGADPLALIGGLEKVHRHLGTPRRLDAQREKRMTHPSLARRVQAIRRKAGIEIATGVELPKTIEGRKEGMSIRFTEDALETSHPARTHRYDAIESLLVRQVLGGWELMGRTATERIRVALTAEGAVEAQAILDFIDVQFTPEKVLPPVRRSIRLAAALVFLVALFPSISFPPMVLAVLTMVSASAAALAALGTAAIATGAVALRAPMMPYLGEVVPLIAWCLILLGVICLLLLRKTAPDDRSRHLRATLFVLGLSGAIVVIPLVAGVVSGGRTALVLGVRERPSAAILLIAMGAALFVAGRRRMAIVPALGAVAFTLLGTQAAVRWTGDPLVAKGEPAWITPPRPFVAQPLAADVMLTDLHLSPDATAFAVRVSDEYKESNTYYVGTLTSSLVELTAEQLAFIDEKRLLRFVKGDAGPQLEMFDLAGEGSEWKVALPILWNPALDAEKDGTWSISGRTFPSYKLARFHGRVQEPGLKASREEIVIYSVMTTLPVRASSKWTWILSASTYGSEVWRESVGGRESVVRSGLNPGALVKFPDATQWLVSGSDMRSTHVGTIDEETRSIRTHGSIEGATQRIKSGRGSRIAMHTSTSAIIWNLATSKAMRIGCADCTVLGVSLSDRAAGVLVERDQLTVLELYSTDVLR